jgi:hypothetical protein
MRFKRFNAVECFQTFEASALPPGVARGLSSPSRAAISSSGRTSETAELAEFSEFAEFGEGEEEGPSMAEPFPASGG